MTKTPAQNKISQLVVYTSNNIEDYKYEYNNVVNFRLIGTSLSFECENEFSKTNHYIDLIKVISIQIKDVSKGD